MTACQVSGLAPAECMHCPPEPAVEPPQAPPEPPPTDGPEWTRPDPWPVHPMELDARGRLIHVPPVYTVRADRHCPPEVATKLLGQAGWFRHQAPYSIPARCARCHKVLADGDPVKWTVGEGSGDMETHGWCCAGTARVKKGGRPPRTRSSFFR